MAFEAFLPLEGFAGLAVLAPFLGFVAGMAVYTIFVFRFYRFVARRDLFELDLQPYTHAAGRWENSKRIGRYVGQYLLLFPGIILLWSLVFAALLAVLDSQQSVESVLLVSMAVVTTTRVTAYYSEALSEELSKTIPFALLGVVVFDGVEELLLTEVVAVTEAIPEYWHLITAYWAFTVVLEFVLRVATAVRFRTIETVEEAAPTAVEAEDED